MNRRAHTLGRLAVLRRRLADRRTNWIEQTTTDLARTYDLIAVEDLRVRNMVRRPAPKPDPDRLGAFLPNGARAKASLNRAILASVWGRFLTRLEQKMPEGTVMRVDPKNTSRTCAACGHLAHADTNAAINILIRGLSTSAPGYGGVRARKPSTRWERQPTSRISGKGIPGLQSGEDVKTSSVTTARAAAGRQSPGPSYPPGGLPKAVVGCVPSRCPGGVMQCFHLAVGDFLRRPGRCRCQVRRAREGRCGWWSRRWTAR